MTDQISDYAYNYQNGDDESRYCDTGVLAMIFSSDEILASTDLSDAEKQSIIERQEYIDQSMGATPEVAGDDDNQIEGDPTWGYQDEENKENTNKVNTLNRKDHLLPLEGIFVRQPSNIYVLPSTSKIPMPNPVIPISIEIPSLATPVISPTAHSGHISRS